MAARGESNPYASPITEQLGNELIGIFRDGDLLVVHRRASFPGVCVKSNSENAITLRRVTFSYQWIHRQSFDIALSRRWLSVARWQWLKGTCMTILGVVGLFGTPFLVVRLRLPAVVLPAEVIVLAELIAVFLTFYGCSLTWLLKWPLTLKRRTGEFFWLRGAHPDFLSRLPEYPN